MKSKIAQFQIDAMFRFIGALQISPRHKIAFRPKSDSGLSPYLVAAFARLGKTAGGPITASTWRRASTSTQARPLITGDPGQASSTRIPRSLQTSAIVLHAECSSLGTSTATMGFASAPHTLVRIFFRLIATLKLLATLSRMPRGQGVAGPVVPVVW